MDRAAVLFVIAVSAFCSSGRGYSAESQPQEKKALRDKPQPTQQAPSQTMINSPGAIQAGRDVNLLAEAQLIRSLELRLSVEASTAPAQAGPEQYDLGLGSVVAFFTQTDERIRFVSDSKLYDRQVSSTRRAIRFIYQPEDPAQILGRPVKFLGDISTLAVNFAEIFRTVAFNTGGTNTVVELGVIVNGIPLLKIQTTVPAEHAAALNEGQATIDVSAALSGVPAAYAAAIRPVR